MLNLATSEYYTPDQISEALGRKIGTPMIRHHVRTGILPATRIGKRIFIKGSDAVSLIKPTTMPEDTDVAA